MAGHFYFLDEATGEITPDHTLTEAKARDRGAFASITTKIKLAPAPELDDWRTKKIVELCCNGDRFYGETLEEYAARIEEATWGYIERSDGKVFKSSEFGTLCHAECENWNNDRQYVPPPEWLPHVQGWMDYASNNIHEVWAAEYMVACPVLKTGGTIDLIAWPDGSEQLELFDYKFRGHKVDKKTQKSYGPVRDKDCWQLAIGADLVRQKLGLDYTPRINSVIIDPPIGTVFVKQWTKAAQEKGLQKFYIINEFYNRWYGFA